MSFKQRGCINDPAIFCYICGNFVSSVQRQNILPFVKNVYYAYFGIKLEDQVQSWAPNRVCRNCESLLRQWSTGKQKYLAFGISMAWSELKGHDKECHFCLSVVDGYNVKNKHKIQDPNLPCAMQPIPCGPSIPIPLPQRMLETVEDFVSKKSWSDSQLTESSEYECHDDQQPKPFNHKSGHVSATKLAQDISAQHNLCRPESAQVKIDAEKNEPTWLYSALIKNKFVCEVNSFAFNDNSLHWEHGCIFALPLRSSVNHYYKQVISAQ